MARRLFAHPERLPRGPFECVKAVLPGHALPTLRQDHQYRIGYGVQGHADDAALCCLKRRHGGDGPRTRRPRHLLERARPGLTLSDTIIGRNDYGAARMANVETRSLKPRGTRGDLVGALVFLASYDSDFMTGQTLLVDGGSAMH
jgi:NAD(P)-dependent dehydrogenase (short-subunit alcohol dehydrogenase family)